MELTGEQPRFTLVYALHSGNLYGTERMALHTAAGLSDRFDSVFLAPQGTLIEEARKQGFQAIPFAGILQFALQLRKLLAQNRRLAFLATGVMHSAICLSLNIIYRRHVAHLHLVHGGACERLSYGRKKLLNGWPVTFVAVSNYVRDRLVANGVRASRIHVIENFLPEEQIAAAEKHALSHRTTKKRLVVISRLDPEKRVSLLLEALDLAPDLQQLETHVFGTGWELETLRARAAARGLNIKFEGFNSDISSALAKFDLLVHLCPVEPFGLAILEALAAGVPVLVPNAGGAGLIVRDGQTGFQFEANSAQHLVRRLRDFVSYSNDYLDGIAAAGRMLLRNRFSAAARIADYRNLLLGGLS